MIKLTDEMRENVNSALEKGYPCIISTASKDGEPGLGFRGSLMIWDDEHIAWWERGRRNQMVNMEENPKAAVVFRNNELNIGWRFYGEVTFHPQGDPLWEQVWERVVPQEQARDPEREGTAIIMRVDIIRGMMPEALQQRD